MIVDRRKFLQWLVAIGSTLVFEQGLGKPSSEQHKRIIPSSGEPIPVVGIGSWLTFGIDPDDSVKMNQRLDVMREFLRRGGGVLDSSPMYGRAQEVIGRCLKRIDHYQGLFSATKVWVKTSRAGMLEMEQSRLYWGLPRIDLMQVHNLLDWETHLPTLHAMKAEGKIRYVGVTTSHGRRHKELLQIMRTQKLDFVQFTYNLLDREAEQFLLPLAADKGIAVIINRPFQRGGLFDQVGKHSLPAWAAEIDCINWAQFFLKFIVSHPVVTCAIPATSRVDHLQENMEAAYGRMPDEHIRKKMVKHIESL